MNIWMGFLVWFAWTLLAFVAGMLTHWWATRKQRHLLKRYRQQAQVLRRWGKPLE